MSKTHYLPSTDEGKVTWLNNFSLKLQDHTAILGISPEQLTSVQNDASMFSYIVNLVNAFRSGLSERVGYKDILKNGSDGAPLSPVPVFNNTPAPTVVSAGIFKRIGKLVQSIKSNPSYNESIGGNLGIIGAEHDRETLDIKPVLKIKMDAGRPLIMWKKGKADSLDIYVDRGDNKGFVYLANDAVSISSKYIMNVELPHAIERKIRNEAIIIPVITRTCIWNIHGLDKSNCPNEAKPISEFKNKDEAYKEIVKSIEKLL